MSRGLKRTQDGFAALFIVVLAVVFIAAVASGVYLVYGRHHGASPTPTNTTAVIVPCATTNLKLSISNQSGTAGTMYMNADVVNMGTAKCTLSGYPTVFLADGTGSTTGMGAESSSDYTPTSITLAPGNAAHSLLAFPDAGNFANPGICSGASTQLYFYPPASTTYLQTPLVQHACPGFRTTALKAGI
jgi:hypothetical protein